MSNKRKHISNIRHLTSDIRRRAPIVPDLLQSELRLVFCGTAPSRISAREKAYYANPGNQFWHALHRVRLTPRLFHPQEYPKLLSLGIGLTDLCKTCSGNDDELPPEALEREALKKKIRRYKPKLVAFTSKNAASIYFGHKVEYGLQNETLNDTQFYVLCSTSGRARRFWKEEVWRELADIIRLDKTAKLR
ncbi:MAG: mismatch-specific DNA-glycosylase [Pseudomonadota bacterium]|nr:mismatch-specific DNA-glycosylase [Pseudomonadota bacterium]MDE3037546.1 mismatch-specific DNA-glycosylase [Pseudomonadota bacterium]